MYTRVNSSLWSLDLWSEADITRRAGRWTGRRVINLNRPPETTKWCREKLTPIQAASLLDEDRCDGFPGKIGITSKVRHKISRGRDHPLGEGWQRDLERGQWIQGLGKCCLVEPRSLLSCPSDETLPVAWQPPPPRHSAHCEDYGGTLNGYILISFVNPRRRCIGTLLLLTDTIVSLPDASPLSLGTLIII